ncbi:MAG: hypothetical protein AAFZ87_00945 [Planctomycetota bacterium]
MFPHTWRAHWALDEDPFVQEDADKDPVLARIPDTAVHSSFDRLFGSAGSPAPGVVFGEKGSGKSSLRLAMRRRLAAESAFFVEYVEFDSFLTEARKADRLPPSAPKTARKVVDRFSLTDHVDALLSLGTTKLVDSILDGGHPRVSQLAPKSKATLMALASLYYRSDDRSGAEVDRGLQKRVKLRSSRPFLRSLGKTLGTLAGLALAAVPHADVVGLELPFEVGDAGNWYGGGAALFGATWLFHAINAGLVRRRASQAARSVRVVPRDPEPLQRLLGRLGKSVSSDLALPDGEGIGTRLVLLQRFIRLLGDLGHSSYWVLMDRVDEATALAGNADLMRTFVESMLEHRLLQFEGLALKLFLPIELSRLYLGASPDELKSMRLDKANSIPELRWSGHELVEVAVQRLRAVRPEGTPSDRPGGRLAEFFDDDLTGDDVRDALGELGTPRLAFGFLGALFSEHARELDDDLAAEDPAWRIPRRRFDIIHASWVDRARGLRRSLN